MVCARRPVASESRLAARPVGAARSTLLRAPSQLCDQRAHDGRLAGAGAAGDHHHAAPSDRVDGAALLGGELRGLEELRRRRPRRGQQLLQPLRQLHLGAMEARQIERVAFAQDRALLHQQLDGVGGALGRRPSISAARSTSGASGA